MLPRTSAELRRAAPIRAVIGQGQFPGATMTIPLSPILKKVLERLKWKILWFSPSVPR